MSDVFISYSRKDSAFVRQLHDALNKAQREVWVDWQDIPLTANWWDEICAGIESAHTFICVVTPYSLSSPICHMEIAYAIHNHKRLLPILRTEIDEKDALQQLAEHPLDECTRDILDDQNIVSVGHHNWLSLSRHNWLFFKDDDDFDENFSRLIEAIETDLDHVKLHTRLLIQTIEWEEHQQANSFLLFGDALKEADQWLTNSKEKTPQPTDRQLGYIMASHRNVGRRNRFLFLGVTLALSIAIGLSILSLMMFGQAINSLTYSNMTEHVLETQLSDVLTTVEFLEGRE